MTNLNTRKQKRALRVRSRLSSRSALPRLIVKRSNLHLHAQVVAAEGGKVLTAFSTLSLKDFKGNKTAAAKEVGIKLADLLSKAKVESIVLDRGHYRYHGRLKALVESLREKGVKI